MKRAMNYAFIFAILEVLLRSTDTTLVEGMTIAKRATTKYSIVTARHASAAEMTAAMELQEYLKQITGADFPLRTENEVAEDALQILVGRSVRTEQLASDVDWASLKQDGILIRTVGKTLILAGGRPRGTLYAVYSFLEDALGCRWWTSSESYIPSRKTLRIPRLDIQYTPKLIYREAYYRDPTENPLFAAKLKFNGHFFAIPEDYGGHIAFAGFVHTFYGLIPPGKYFATHPEWFSEIGGKRTADRAQLCLTNGEMREQLTQAALEWIRSNPSAGIVSISQNDCQGPCECAKCKAVQQEEGSPAGAVIRFVNAVAEDIEKKFPNVLVETLAYQYTRKPPLHAKPRNNVVVRLCSIECDFSKPLDSDANKEFRDDLLGWKAIAPNLFIWDYVTDFWCYLQPFPNMRVLGPNIRFFVNNNTIGLFEQGDSYTTTGDFIRLRTWLFGHLEWDPSLDQRKLEAEFLKGYYGGAAPYLRRYLDLIHDTFEKSGLVLPCGTTDLSYLTAPVMEKATRLFAKAERAVAKDPVLAERVRRERMPLDFAWLVRYNDLKQEAETTGKRFFGPEDPVKACREFIALARFWKTDYFKEGVPFESRAPELELRFSSVPSPEEFSRFPEEDCIQLTPERFFLYGAPNWADLTEDASASTGTAARMPGDHNKYGVQCPIDDELGNRLDGSWKCYVIARCETGAGDPVIRCGVFDKSLNRSRAWFDQKPEKGDAEHYQTFYLGSREFTSDMYLWVAPSGNVESTKAIYVDRFVLLRDRQG